MLCGVSELSWPFPSFCLLVLVTVLSSLAVATGHAVSSITSALHVPQGWRAPLIHYGQSYLSLSSCACCQIQLPGANLNRRERQGWDTKRHIIQLCSGRHVFLLIQKEWGGGSKIHPMSFRNNTILRNGWRWRN